jgi:hypothetical protein
VAFLVWRSSAPRSEGPSKDLIDAILTGKITGNFAKSGASEFGCKLLHLHAIPKWWACRAPCVTEQGILVLVTDRGTPASRNACHIMAEAAESPKLA